MKYKLLATLSIFLVFAQPVAAWKNKSFELTDTNSDGLLSKDEYIESRIMHAQSLDINKSEYRTMLEKNFIAMDVNKDEHLSPKEIEDYFPSTP